MRDWIGFCGYFGGYPEVQVSQIERVIWNLLPAERQDHWDLRCSCTS